MEEIFTRRSIRSYTDKRISKDSIYKIIKAGFQAPSAKNQHVERFLVIDNQNLIIKLSQVCKGTMTVSNAKELIAVYFDKNDVKVDELVSVDLGMVCQNMMLEARALGIGSCMIGVYPLDDKTQAINKILRLTDSLTCFALVCFGYPKNENEFYSKNYFDESKIKFNEVD